MTPLVTVGNVLAFTDASVANGTTYRYAVSAISAAGRGPEDGRGHRRPRHRTERAAEPDGDGDQVGHRAHLGGAHVDGGSAITGYRVYRGTTAGAETLYVSYGPDAIGMTDTAVAKRTTYFYRVTAVNVLGESVFVREVSATAR